MRSCYRVSHDKLVFSNLAQRDRNEVVFLGGGFGSVLRYLLNRTLNSDLTGIPYGTFATNILGSLLIGIILGLSAKGNVLTQNQTLLLATGFCGVNFHISWLMPSFLFMKFEKICQKLKSNNIFDGVARFGTKSCLMGRNGSAI